MPVDYNTKEAVASLSSLDSEMQKVSGYFPQELDQPLRLTIAVFRKESLSQPIRLVNACS